MPESQEKNEEIRFDHKTIIDLVGPDSKVLDLGCGDGTLLSLLIQQKNCKCTGIEIDEKEQKRGTGVISE